MRNKQRKQVWAVVAVLAAGLVGILWAGEQRSLKELMPVLARRDAVNLILNVNKAGAIKVPVPTENRPIGEVLAEFSTSYQVGWAQDQSLHVLTTPALSGTLGALPALAEVKQPASISLDFQAADIRDVLRLIRQKSGPINIVAEKSVRGNLSLKVTDLPWPQVLRGVVGAMGLDLRMQGTSILITDAARMKDLMPMPLPESAPGGVIDVHVRDTDIRDVVGLVARQFGRDYITGRHVRGNVTLDLTGVGEDEAVHLVSRTNGFLCRKADGVWLLNDGKLLDEGEPALGVKVSPSANDLLSMEFRDTELAIILRIVEMKSKWKIAVSPDVKGTVTLRLTDRSPQDILRLLAAAQGFSVQFSGDRAEVISFADDRSVKPAPLVMPKTVPEGPPPARPLPAGEVPPPAPKLRLVVLGIVGNEQGRRALVMDHLQHRLLEPGMTVAGRYQVREIRADAVVVTDSTSGAPQTFPLN